MIGDGPGQANQRIAQHADDVLLLVAGLPWRLIESTGIGAFSPCADQNSLDRFDDIRCYDTEA